MRQDIGELRQCFYDAHSAISFYPEVRAESCVNDFSEELDADLAEIGDVGNYREKYIGHLRNWASKKARCMSPMITGPAKFPVDSNMKRMNAERRAWEEFRNWRTRYIKRVNAVKTKSPEEELDSALEELESFRAYREMMKGVNKIVRKNISDEEKAMLIAEEYELHERTIRMLLEVEPPFRQGFEAYTLTNYNAKIKRLEQKVLTMKARIKRKKTFESIAFPGGVIDIENDRVVVRHDEKPDKSVIDNLKSRGFRWSPNWKCWCRKHTEKAIYDAKNICMGEQE